MSKDGMQSFVDSCSCPELTCPKFAVLCHISCKYYTRSYPIWTTINLHIACVILSIRCPHGHVYSQSRDQCLHVNFLSCNFLCNSLIRRLFDRRCTRFFFLPSSSPYPFIRQLHWIVHLSSNFIFANSKLFTFTGNFIFFWVIQFVTHRLFVSKNVIPNDEFHCHMSCVFLIFHFPSVQK